MNNILITGGNSFICKSIEPHLLKRGHHVFSPDKSKLNLLNNDSLDNTCKFIKPDFIIHCAVKGGRRTHEDSPQDLYENLLMLNNLLHLQDKYNFKLILFSSGAEYDRRGNIFDVKEGENHSIPIDYYGLSKYIQTNLVRGKDNIINLKLFNVFGEAGMDDSFISTCINKCLKKEDIEIWEDKFFTTFYADDLSILIENLIIENNKKYLEFNCGYETLYKLSDLAALIKGLTFSKSKIIIKQEIGKSYCGNCKKLIKRGYKFHGLINGLNNYIRYIKNKKN